MTGPRCHTDRDGPWWDFPAHPLLRDLARWRGRLLPDGTIQARDRNGEADDVSVRPGLDQPWKILQAACDGAIRRAALRSRGGSAD